jgi:drug/metabolite transporter (DMT)-like permease
MRSRPPSSTLLRASTSAGPAAALGSAVLFGATTPIAKTFVQSSSPLLVAGLLYLGSGAGLALWRVIQDRGWRESGLSRDDWLWLAAAVLAGGLAAPALLMLGLQRTDAATASLLLNLEAVFSATLAWFLFREATSRRVVVGFLAILAGALVLSSSGGLARPSEWSGLLSVVAACLCWGLDNNLTQKISGADARLTACVKGLVAGAMNTALALLLGAQLPAPAALAAVLGLGFLGYGVSLVLYILALRGLGTARTGAYFATAPFIGTAIAVAVYGESVTAGMYVAALLMIIGVWLHVTERHGHEHEHRPLLHTHAHTHDSHHQHGHAEGLDTSQPHVHEHRHAPQRHSHRHFPDAHHEHQH